MNERRRCLQILNALIDEPCTPRDLMSALDLHYSTVYSNLHALNDSGLVKLIGPDSNAYWRAACAAHVYRGRGRLPDLWCAIVKRQQ